MWTKCYFAFRWKSIYLVRTINIDICLLFHILLAFFILFFVSATQQTDGNDEQMLPNVEIIYAMELANTWAKNDRHSLSLAVLESARAHTLNLGICSCRFIKLKCNTSRLDAQDVRTSNDISEGRTIKYGSNWSATKTKW